MGNIGRDRSNTVTRNPQPGTEIRMTLHTSDYDYSLPQELIAQHPTEQRGTSRLLVLQRDSGELTDRTFLDFPSLLSAGDLLVLNTTRVRHARLIGTRPSRAPAEVLLIHPGADGTWIAMGKPGSAMKPGKRILLGDGVSVETVSVLDDGNRTVRFVGATAEDAIRRFGKLPLPPYIEREPDAADETGYQTIYAEREGSVAAPTAGLHFTPPLLQAVQDIGVSIARLDLEVGPGTFKPVETEELAAHTMHPERYVIGPDVASLIERTKREGHMIWAVGTTVVRALESAALDGKVRPGTGETSLMITPGFRFQIVDRLLTNFHLPRSTLLMLVSAFAGHELVTRAYRHAVEQRYRFYSYGDAMAIM